MSNEPRKASEFEQRLKQLIQDARWGGVPIEAIKAVLRASAETVE